ncbi:hypothetical protein FW789_10805 [Pseudomonas sp. 1121_17]
MVLSGAGGRGGAWIGAAAQPFRDTRPLLQGPRKAGPHRSSGMCGPCRSGLVSRKGRIAAPYPPNSPEAALVPSKRTPS